jgi:hypothetical protein
MLPDLPKSLLQFIRASIPTYQAAEVLLFFAAHADRSFTVEEVAAGMRPVVVGVPAVGQYAALFVKSQLIAEENGRYRYGPASPELERSIGELARAYNERPVTLIRAIYRIADDKIQSFADAFDFRKDES